MSYPLYQIPAQLIIALLAYLAFSRRFALPNSRQAVQRWCAAWVIAATAPYWIAGPMSFNINWAELDLAVPILQYLASLPPEIKFAHDFAGGMDAHMMSRYAGQYVSFERFLVTALPAWLGLAVHRIIIISISLAGAYRLSRAFGAGRASAFAVALFSTMATDQIHTVSFWHGTAYAILPLAAYLLICRQGRRYYWLGAAGFGLWFAAGSTLPMGVINLFFALLAAVAAAGWRTAPRTAGAFTVVAVCVLLNRHEHVYAVASLAPYTWRGNSDGNSIFDILSYVTPAPYAMASIVAACSLAASAFAWSRRQCKSGLLRAAAGVVLYPLAVLSAASLPYELAGLKFLESAGWNYSGAGFTVPVIILAACVLRTLPPLTVPLAALSAAKLAVVTLTAVPVWLSTGGLSTARLPSLVDPPWKPEGLVRVMNTPFRLWGHQLAALGYESATGMAPLQTAASIPYWLAVRSIDPDSFMDRNSGHFSQNGPHLMNEWTDSFAKCCQEYDLKKFGVDVDLLRLINIGFIISRVPLTGPYVEKITGPPDGTILPRSGTPRFERIAPYIEWIIDPPPPYVYELNAPFPRIYAPKGRAAVTDGADYKAVMAAVREHALNGALVLRESDSQTFGPAESEAEIISYEQVLNGYDVTLDSSDDSGAAAVILNVVYTPFWRAYADGAPVPLVQANQIQMAAVVPPGTRSLTFRYERPLLREKLFNW